MELFYEIQAANFLGFRTAAAFRAAVDRGDVPPPTKRIGRCPVWSRVRLERWILGEDEASSAAERALAQIEAM